MNENNITCFEDFHKFISEHGYSNFVYRGEKSLTYKLRSSFGRDQFRTDKNTPGIEKNYFNDFKRRSRPYLEYEPKDDLEWLSIAQHHGLHTRLLDWTSNPLVALYFAVEDRLQNKDSVIYALNTNKIKTAGAIKNPFDIQEDMLYYPNHVTKRIIAQSGLFTIHCNPSEIFSNSSLEKVTIKKECLIDIYVFLDGYNINKFSLFPDLQGLSYSLTENWIR